MTKRYCLGFICLLIIGPFGCSRNDGLQKVNLLKKIDAKNTERPSGESPVRIAVGGMTTPRAGYIYYKKLLNYIGEKLGRKVEFVEREDYAAINNMLQNREINVAFVCGGPSGYYDNNK